MQHSGMAGADRYVLSSYLARAARRGGGDGAGSPQHVYKKAPTCSHGAPDLKLCLNVAILQQDTTQNLPKTPRGAAHHHRRPEPLWDQILLRRGESLSLTLWPSRTLSSI